MMTPPPTAANDSSARWDTSSQVGLPSSSIIVGPTPMRCRRRTARDRRRPHERPAQQADADERERAQRDLRQPSRRPVRHARAAVVARRPEQVDAHLHGRREDQPDRDRRHAGERVLDRDEAAVVLPSDAERDHDAGRPEHHAGERRARAGEAGEALADHHRQVADRRPRHDLRDREQARELLRVDPATPLDERAIRERQDAAEARQRELRERDEQLGRPDRRCRRRLGRFGRRVGARRVAGCHRRRS